MGYTASHAGSIILFTTESIKQGVLSEAYYFLADPFVHGFQALHDGCQFIDRKYFRRLFHISEAAGAGRHYPHQLRRHTVHRKQIIPRGFFHVHKFILGGYLAERQDLNAVLLPSGGFEADTLEITIDDADGKIELPPRGVEISVAIGWRGEPLTHKGVFTVDEVSHSGPPDQLVVTARSADFRQDFNVKREYSWHDIKVGKVVSAIAGRYNLTPAVSRQLIDIEIDHADQTTRAISVSCHAWRKCSAL